ncbi:facilitated trehalose transporter Tret1-like isoform X2 [Penaeus japonicus]|nr:facilitated trehalose transporter Tret1-like isoform X2 [Penaeus japonicus]XP_042866284.1 facilitated trehalose transporter Tret1-like isoform X2 [Penaeus japonicus]
METTSGRGRKDNSMTKATRSVSPRQILCVLIMACTPILNGMLSGWTAVLPKMQEDRSRFTVTVQDVTWLASLNQIVGIGICPLAGTLGEYLGPRRLLFLATCPVPGFWLLQAYTPWLPLLYVCRAALAISTSLVCTMVQPLIAEICPAEIRGLAGSMPEVMGCVGILLSYVLAYLLPWDVATAVSAAPYVPLVLLMLLVPESPYWLVRKKKVDAAERSLRVLLGRNDDVTKELNAIRSTTTLKQSRVKNQLRELRRGHNIRPVVLIIALFILRELGGKAPVYSYTVYMFRSAGVELDAFYCTVFVGITRFGCTLVSAFIQDRLGRKPMLVASATASALALIAAGATVFLKVEGASWVPLAAMLVYVGAYALGLGPILWAYLGELLPTPVRSVAASLVTFCHFSSSFGVNYMFFEVVSAFGLGSTLMVFGSVNLVVAAVVFGFIPETKGRSLQDMEKAFAAKSPRRGKDNPAFDAEGLPPRPSDPHRLTRSDSPEAAASPVSSSTDPSPHASCTPPSTDALPCIPVDAADARCTPFDPRASDSKNGDSVSSCSHSSASTASVSLQESSSPASIRPEESAQQITHL